MARPKQEQPTPAELEVLQVLWERGPMTVRQVMEVLGAKKPRAYTSVMSLMSDMAEKGLLVRRAQGKAFVYAPAAPREKTLGNLLGDLLQRAFGGSASALVAHLLNKTSPKELEKIRETIEAHKRKTGGE
ncbi:MAG: BlaI/MecI/CopY family transcriptional regulator [Bacillota bacterium]